jgi:hypothetical protein
MKPYALLRSASLRLLDEDFAATLPQAPTKPRKAVEGRLFSWAADVVTRLSDRFGALEVHAVRDPDGDGSGVVFVRERMARKRLEDLAEDERSLRPRMGEAPYLPHLHVALVVYFEAVELRIDLPARAWVDAENLRARVADPTSLLELTSALEVLPESFEIACVPGERALPAHLATPDELREFCERARTDPSSFRVRWRIPKSVVLGFTEDLGDALEDALYALSAVTKLVAWAEDNDVLGLVTRREARRERERDPEDDRAAVPSERPARRPVRDDEPRAKRTFREPRTEVPPEPKATENERPSRSVPVRLERKILRRAPRLFDVDPQAPVEKGARVQVLAGPFAGRVGEVVELFATQEAKVALGLLVTRVPVADLVACAPKGSGRSPLPSSHRKLPTRP